MIFSIFLMKIRKILTFYQMIESIKQTITDWITAISAFGSFIVLIFYTYYTRKMQSSIARQVNEQTRQTEELIHQRRLGIMPYLIIEINNSQLLITNTGNGIALNIEIKSFKNNELLNSHFEIISKILPKETIGVSGADIIHNDIRNSLELYYGGDETHIIGKICFQDLEGNFYEEDLKNFSKKTIRYSFPKLIVKD